MLTSTQQQTSTRVQGNHPANIASVDDVRITLLHKGDCLFHMGDRLSGIYLIHVGALKLSRTTEAGEEQISGFFMPGDIVGLDAMESGLGGEINSGVSKTQAIALDTTTVQLVTYASLRRGTGRISFQQLVQHMSTSINRDRDLQLMLSQRTADRRLAWFLSEYSDRLSARGLCADEFTLPVTRTDLAAYLGMALETVCRELAIFDDAGLIKKNRRCIVLLDIDQLRLIARGQEALVREVHH